MPYKDPAQKRAADARRELTRPKRDRVAEKRAYRVQKRATKQVRFVSVDGEDLDGRFSMFAASTGDRINTPGRDITLGEACHMLMSIVERERRPGYRLILAGYSINYDLQRLIRTLHLMTASRLLDRQKTDVWHSGRRYVVEYMPKKCLSIYEKGGTALKLYDVSSFFQQSFVETCKTWIPEYRDEIELMATWKARRGGFREADRAAVSLYNDTENRCLDEVMGRLHNSFERYGVPPPTHMWGPGAVADIALKVNGMHNHYAKAEEYPEEVRQMIERAFFGGRAQVFQVGVFENAYDYDLHSAYPAAISLVLASAKGEWTEAAPNSVLHDLGLYRVTWNTPADNPLTPFPHRGAGGNITYPHSGEGVYWGIEVKSAIEVFGSACIQVIGGWVFAPEDQRCWDWYTDLANSRVALKERGERDLERVAKLVLNSVYGKTAQTKPCPGRWTSLLWAGMITAFCRSRMLELAAQNPLSLIFAATDGLMTTEPLDVSDETVLGQWGRGGEGPLFVVQPGVYRFSDKCRTRGFRGADWNEMRRQWLLEGKVEYEHSTNRFISLQEGLDRGRPDLMAEWEEEITIYRSPVTARPGTLNARVPAAPIPTAPSLSKVRAPSPEDKIPRGYGYRWKAAMIILGKAQARRILAESGIEEVIRMAELRESSSNV